MRPQCLNRSDKPTFRQVIRPGPNEAGWRATMREWRMDRRVVCARSFLRILSGTLIVLAAAAGRPLHADSWPAARIKEVFSESREWFVRVTPGDSIGETVGFAGSPKGKHARAEFYRRAADRSYRLTTEIPLHNPVAPVLFLVTDRGYLVTLDNWHNMGFGKAIASYSPDGRVVFAGELKDVFSPDEVAAFRTSVSSIWWRTETVYVRDGQQSIYVALNDKGSELSLEPETGRWQACEPRGEKHQCRNSNTARVWRAYQEPALRK